MYDLSCSPSILLSYTLTAVSDLTGSRLSNKFPCLTCSDISCDTLTFSTNESITSSVGFQPYKHPPFYNFDWSGTPLPYDPSDDTRNRDPSPWPPPETSSHLSWLHPLLPV